MHAQKQDDEASLNWSPEARDCMYGYRTIRAIENKLRHVCMSTHKQEDEASLIWSPETKTMSYRIPYRVSLFVCTYLTE